MKFNKVKHNKIRHACNDIHELIKYYLLQDEFIRAEDLVEEAIRDESCSTEKLS